MIARWLSPALAVVSLVFLAHSFYVVYGRQRGNRASRVTTWISAVSVLGFWAYRLFS